MLPFLLAMFSIPSLGFISIKRMDNKEDMDETNAADESLQFKLIRRMIKRLVITVIRILRLRLFNPPTDKIDSSFGRGVIYHDFGPKYT